MGGPFPYWTYLVLPRSSSSGDSVQSVAHWRKRLTVRVSYTPHHAGRVGLVHTSAVRVTSLQRFPPSCLSSFLKAAVHGKASSGRSQAMVGRKPFHRDTFSAAGYLHCASNPVMNQEQDCLGADFTDGETEAQGCTCCATPARRGSGYLVRSISRLQEALPLHHPAISLCRC